MFSIWVDHDYTFEFPVILVATTYSATSFPGYSVGMSEAL
jgi:hypothetical protein